MHPDKHSFTPDPGAENLYNAEGKVVLNAVAAYIESRQAADAQPSLLDEHTNSIYTVSVDQLSEGVENAEEDARSWLGRPGSIGFAINTYLSYEIGRSLHKGRTPVSAGFTGNPNFVPDLQTETKRVLEHICDEQPGVFSFLNKTKETIAPWSAPVENLRIVGGVVVAG